MGVLPKSRLKTLEFFEARLQQMSDNAGQIGVNVDDITELQAHIGAARTAYEEHDAAMAAQTSTTASWYAASDALNKFGSELVQGIGLFARRNNDPDVYGLAGLPLPTRRREELPPPPTPVSLTGSLLNTGAVELKWRPPSGGFGPSVRFEIERRIVTGSVNGPWELIGSVGSKRTFSDTTLPSGSAAGSYRVFAVRYDTRSDASEPITVQFGFQMPGGESEAVAEAA